MLYWRGDHSTTRKAELTLDGKDGVTGSVIDNQ